MTTDPAGDDRTRMSYDRVADSYADKFLGELASKPFDRALLGLMVELAEGLGPIADLGCGPGHVARHLHERGAATLGIDLSPRMIEIAAATHPGIGFHVGDMRALRVPDQAWGGVVAPYSIIHLTPDELPLACAEFYRVLRPRASALVAWHLGEETRHVDEWFDRIVSMDFHFYPRTTIEAAFTGAGFVIDSFTERRAYPGEVETTRAYLLAHRPAE